MKTLGRFLLFLFSIGSIGAIAGVVLFAAVIYKYGQSLPDYTNLKDYKPPVVTRVHAGDGRFLAEFAQERRIFIPVQEIPDTVIHAFTSAEDQNFYKHKGVDIFAVVRALVINFRNHGEGKRPVGASTITQQVAKNFLLTNEVSYERKIREAILAYKLEQTFSKDRILELYLNQIFLGQRSYGVAAAALNYFNKPLGELTIAEAAYLAALPKGPNNYDPETRHGEAVARRNWVIDRMADDGHITRAQAEEAKAMPLVTIPRQDSDVVNAPYYAEEVRRELHKEFGEEGVYRGGLSVRTSLDPRLQSIAETALQNGLMAYDHKHGWRGPLQQGGDVTNIEATLRNTSHPPAMLSGWSLAMVLDKNGAVGLMNSTKGKLYKNDLLWTKAHPLKVGDIVMVEPATLDNTPDAAENVKAAKDSKDAKPVSLDKDTYRLRQVPVVQGAVVALDPNTGRVLAMQGGWKSEGNAFNRATQAKRQPGSAFKPFVYLAALDKGFTPSSIIMDTPITFTDTAGNVWKPENYHGDYLGPTPLRVGVEKSRNLMTIHLAQQIGIKTVVEYANRFGIDDNMPANLSNVLGADETSLMQLTTAYGMIVNGGKKITPTFIDRIQDRNGMTIKRADARPCEGCGPLIKWENQMTPDIPDTREEIADPRTTYQMVSILEGVVQRGTAKALSSIDRPLAGKTGTTNDSKDAWFIGFTPDLVFGVFVGYDEPKSLGDKETGASLAVPIFKEFIQKALDGVPPTPFRVPKDVRMVQVNARNGKPTSSSDPDAIWEPFLAGTEPDNTYAPAISSGTKNDSSSLPDDHDNEIKEPLSADDMLKPNPDNSSEGTGEGMGGVY